MWRTFGLLVLLVAVSPAVVSAADSGAPPPASSPRVAAAASETPAAPATLRFFNREIFTFRVPYVGHSPAGRAAVGNERIRAALARGGTGAVQVVRTPQGLEVLVDGIHTFRILEGDLDANDGQTFDEAAVVVTRRLEEAIAAARQSGPSRQLLRELVLAAIATAVLCLAVWILLIVRSWIRRRIDARLAKRIDLGLKEHAGIVRMIRAAGNIVFGLVMAVLIEEWLRYVLSLFPYTRPWADNLTGFVGGIVSQVWAAGVEAVPGLVMVAVIAALAHFATRIVRMVSRGIEAGRYRLFGIDAEVAQPSRRLVTAAIWLFALAMAYPYLPGSSSEAFKGLTVLLGLMLSLGASGIVGQAAGGFILTFARALRSGEWVRIGDIEGAVVNVGVFSTKIRTYADEEVSIPNTVVLATTVRNFSRPEAAQASTLEASVSIGYGTPWRQVHALLVEAAGRTPELERQPPPEVLQTALSDFYIQYILRVRLRDQLRRPAVLSALNANIQDTFNEHGVQIMSPHYVLDPPAPVIVPKGRWLGPAAGQPQAPGKDSAT
ncbi:MAG TPA: mechanosensitive ion channel family protein [Candidatus Bathyarchaeia archaeon]|nr:mechanosensitive ion channel family protein [Candidatus Bathyarchaeia archaeon]